MNDQQIRSVAIIGGQLTGWTAAAAIAHVLQGRDIRITVVELPGSEPDSLAEATLPFTRKFHYSLGIDERDIMAFTQATFRLGTEFKGWWSGSPAHFLPLGSHGAGIGFLAFQHYAIRQRLRGDETPLNTYSLAAMASAKGKFAHPVEDPASPLSTLTYGLHVDTAQYAKYMRLVANTHGTRSIEADMQGARLREDDGFIEAVSLDNGEELQADLFIDCSGNRALLIGEELDNSFEDWSSLLPLGHSGGQVEEATSGLPPFTSISASESGWERRLPLQDRTVREAVSATAPAASGNDPARRFRRGRMQRFWDRNCVALGLAAGGLDPLAAGHLHLVQRGILRLLEMFPDRDCNPVLAGEYNLQTEREFDNLRDFHLAHYLAASEPDSDAWKAMRAVEATDTLAQRIRIFENIGQLPLYRGETFNENEWASLFLTQGRWGDQYNHSLDSLDSERLDQRFVTTRELIRQAAEQMPPHQAFLAQYCPGIQRGQS